MSHKKEYIIPLVKIVGSYVCTSESLKFCNFVILDKLISHSNEAVNYI